MQQSTIDMRPVVVVLLRHPFFFANDILSIYSDHDISSRKGSDHKFRS